MQKGDKTYHPWHSTTLTTCRNIVYTFHNKLYSKGLLHAQFFLRQVYNFRMQIWFTIRDPSHALSQSFRNCYVNKLRVKYLLQNVFQREGGLRM
jgi:hypothetical protein